MTKLTFVAVALVAAAAYSAQASAAGSNAASRRAHASTVSSSKITDCVRAPNVGSFATAPYTEPPCMPGTMR
ncbi:hypothetical protein [Bradyrhizobium macuxiense]|uniref:hypothetical protein n=1 Tax=Bradyrhizobium macuxiense TaxID=1755647 RepID=UPI0009E6F8ED|nr:hypothetical protein [Bradyrhizobium macuxiense]